MTQGAPPTSDLRPAAGHDQAQRVAAILRLTPRSPALTAVACAISAITLAGDIHTGTVVMWLATALIVCAGRYAIFLAHRSNATRLSPELWENTAACGAFAMGCTWAALTMLGPLPGSKILFVALVLLDSKNAKEFHELFFRLRDEFGQTFVIVTHNQEFAAMTDRKLEIKDGRMV